MSNRLLFPPKTPDQTTKSLADYLPGGRVFQAKNTAGTNLRQLLVGLAVEIARVDGIMNDIIAEQDPRTTQQLLEEWESALGIPDGCFNADGTLEERRSEVVIKLSLAINTAESFVALAAEFGFVVTVESGAVHGAFTMIFPIDFYDTGDIARHTLIVHLSHSLNPNLFDFIFPFIFGPRQSNIVECLFQRLKPANVNVVFRYDLP